MTLMMAMGIPVNDDVNRANAKRLGMPPGFPWPPHYPNSVQMPCRKCKGLVWVGPHLQEQLAAWPPTILLCVFCLVIEQHRLGADVTLMKLSRDEATET